MERKPIVYPRKPIVSRTAIYNRIACCSNLVSYQTCQLCSKFQDCAGKLYVDKNSIEPKEYYRVIHVPSDFEDWETLESEIWELNDQQVYLRLVIDRNVPDRILWATSYSERNVLQINVNMMYLDENFLWIQKLMAMAGNCGLYSLLFLYPIVPELVKTYHVIEVLDCFRNAGYHHTTLKFCEFSNCEEIDGYINFNGIPVSTRYLERIETGWKCTSEYLTLFLNKVNLYAIPRKISVTICGRTDDCTGLGG